MEGCRYCIGKVWKNSMLKINEDIYWAINKIAKVVENKRKSYSSAATSDQTDK